MGMDYVDLRLALDMYAKESISTCGRFSIG